MITDDIIDRVMQLISIRGANYEYFFDHLTTPNWIEPLAARGMFLDPPAARSDGKFISYPVWPESRYLVRVASACPDLVLATARRIPLTENCRVHEDIAEMALAMPPHHAQSLAKTIMLYLQTPSQILLPETAARLIVTLTDAGIDRPTIALAREVLAILPDYRVSNTDSGALVGFHPTPRARCSVWEYERLLQMVMPGLVACAGLRTLTMLCDLLDQSIRYSRVESDNEAAYDGSFIWRPEVETDAMPPRDLRDVLVSAVRDAAMSLAQDHGCTVLQTVERHPFRVFRRIGLYLRRVHSHLDPERTAQLITDPDVVRDTHVWHELFWLLSDHFGSMAAETQLAYLQIVAQEPHADDEEEENHTEPVVRATRLEHVWRYRKLLPIERYLDRPWLDKLEALRDQFGELTLTDRLWSGVTIWSGPTSPVTAAEMSGMSVSETLEYLRTWQSPGQLQAPTPEGMSRVLEAAVSANPGEFARCSKAFIDLDPTYARGLLQGLRAAIEQGRTFEWTSVLTLCQWVVEQPREDPDSESVADDRDPGWGQSRRAIASLLRRGLEDRPGAITFSLRARVWQVLETLTLDPDPTPSYEANYGPPNMEPHMLSINSVRGEAMHAVMQYAIWVCSHIDESPKASQVPPWLSELPEVQSVLELHLDSERDPSLAVHSVYGQWLPTLLALDRQWLNSRLVDIFPAGAGLRDLRQAAWDAFILFSRPGDDVFGVLENQYAIAVEDLPAPYTDDRRMYRPDERLAEHLMLYLWHGSLNAEDPNGLVQRFFARAADELRGRAISALGDWLNEHEGALSEELASTLRSLWEERVQEAASSRVPHLREYQAFGGWFASGKFSDSWSLAQLRHVLADNTDLEHDREVVGRLAVLSPDYPISCAQCMVALLLGEPQWRLHAWQDYPKEILAAAVRHHDSEIREQGHYLVNRLLAASLLQFQDLLSDSDDLSIGAGGESS